MPPPGFAGARASAYRCARPIEASAHINAWLRSDRALHVDGRILVFILLGGFSGRFGGYGYGYGHGGVGLIGTILIIVVILMLIGRTRNAMAMYLRHGEFLANIGFTAGIG